VLACAARACLVIAATVARSRSQASCRWHGGRSSGLKTPIGKARAVAAMTAGRGPVGRADARGKGDGLDRADPQSASFRMLSSCGSPGGGSNARSIAAARRQSHRRRAVGNGAERVVLQMCVALGSSGLTGPPRGQLGSSGRHSIETPHRACQRGRTYERQSAGRRSMPRASTGVS